MNIIKRDSFVYPTKEEAKRVNEQYKSSLDEISRDIHLVRDRKLFLSNTFDNSYEGVKALMNILEFNKKGNSIYENFYNKVLISNYHLHTLLCLSQRGLNKFSGGIEAANVILYETEYEMFYIQLANIRDRFYQLVKYCFCMKNTIQSKVNFIKELKGIELSLGNEFDKICNSNPTKICNPLITEAIAIRNSFNHNESPFEKNIYKFEYREKAELALAHFVDFLTFINNQAIPFLLRAPYLNNDK